MPISSLPACCPDSKECIETRSVTNGVAFYCGTYLEEETLAADTEKRAHVASLRWYQKDEDETEEKKKAEALAWMASEQD